MAETLRLELAPFHIKVLSVVTGALKTMGQTHFKDWKLPGNSRYAPVEKTIHHRARGMEGASRMEPEEYAARVVSEIIKGYTGKFWYGASVGAVKFGTTFLPTWMMVCEANLPLPKLAYPSSCFQVIHYTYFSYLFYEYIYLCCHRTAASR